MPREKPTLYRGKRRLSIDVDESVAIEMDRVKDITGISLTLQIELVHKCPDCKKTLDLLADQIQKYKGAIK